MNKVNLSQSKVCLPRTAVQSHLSRTQKLKLQAEKKERQEKRRKEELARSQEVSREQKGDMQVRSFNQGY